MIPADGTVFVVEEANANTGIAAEFAFALRSLRKDITIHKIDLGSEYVPQGSVDILYEQYGLSAQKIADFVQEAINEN